MSVNPKPGRPLTDDEKHYLSQFSWGQVAVQENEAEFGGGEKPSGPPKHSKNKPPAGKPAKQEETSDDKPLSIVDPDSGAKVSISHDTFEQVKGMKAEEVQGILASLGLPFEGSESTLRARLAVHLEDKG